MFLRPFFDPKSINSHKDLDDCPNIPGQKILNLSMKLDQNQCMFWVYLMPGSVFKVNYVVSGTKPASDRSIIPPGSLKIQMKCHLKR